MREIGIGLIGLGNVGTGVVELLGANAKAIEERLGARVVVRAVAVRELDKPRPVAVARELLSTNASAVVARDDVDIVCELMGGLEPARTLALDAVARGKHLVTANKAVLAVHGDEIFAAAQRAHVDVYYEAAVCGGVPVLRMLRDGLASDRVDEIHGIVNGTSNYIVSAMADGRMSFADALADAQARGYAEADPTLDISGGDAAQKLAILMRLCFHARVDVGQIFVEGIDRLAAIDFEYARRFGQVIKPLVIARRLEHALEARVHPAMIPESWLLARVPDAKNALYVRSYALGSSMYYGAGAGMMPTAMAVVSDLIEVGRNTLARAAGAWPTRAEHVLEVRDIRPIEELESRYYLRFSVVDKPGVLGRLTTILGHSDVSIERVFQEGRPQGNRESGHPVRVVVVTHVAREERVREALARIDQTEVVCEPAMCIRML